jgi:glycosyltransferase involved in cell wall biosynthesis
MPALAAQAFYGAGQEHCPQDIRVRVALLHPCFWPEVRRGSERVIRELGDGLLARGHEPVLLTSHPGATTRTVEDGLPIVRARRPDDVWMRVRGWDRYLLHAPRQAVELTRARADVAHALYPADAVAASVLPKPLVFSYMGLPDAAYLGERKGRRWTMEQACARADAVVALSEACARAFEDVLGVTARVISPGVDLEAFAPAPAQRAAQPTVVCSAARAEPRKRVDLLVEAVRRLEGVRLILDRRGPEIDEPFVELRDLDDRAALAAVYREAWVSALPSVNEAFGLVLAEALACGTPVVAADRGGMPEVLGGRDDVGATFAGDSADALADALRRALALHEDSATPARCREQAERFSTDRTTGAYVALYAELLQRRRRRRNGASTSR